MQAESRQSTNYAPVRWRRRGTMHERRVLESLRSEGEVLAAVQSILDVDTGKERDETTSGWSDHARSTFGECRRGSLLVLRFGLAWQYKAGLELLT